MVLNGQRLRAARDAKGLTRLALAKELGIDEKTIYNAEAQRNAPNSDTIARIAGHLGVTIDSLYDKTPETASA